MRKVFISYHHGNDQAYKDALIALNNVYNIFIDRSVNTGDIADSLPTQTIRRKIRDEKLRDSTVTVLLVGTETRYRKHVDWELKSSMINGAVNKRSGILVVMLGNNHPDNGYVSSFLERSTLYPHVPRLQLVRTAAEFEALYPGLPDRIIDNMLEPGVSISIVQWSKIYNDPDALEFLIEVASEARMTNDYDLSRPMRMRDHNPRPGWI